MKRGSHRKGPGKYISGENKEHVHNKLFILLLITST